MALWLTPVVAVLIAPQLARGQAEVAPESYEPPPGVAMSEDPSLADARREAQERRWLIGVQPRLVIAMGTPGGLPRVGWGAGVNASRAVLVMGRARVGLGLSFSYERVQHDKAPSAASKLQSGTQWLSHAAFSADLKLEIFTAGGKVRPWAMIGPAMSIAMYADPPSDGNPDGSYETAVLPALRAAVGCGVEVGHAVEVGGRLEWLATFNGHKIAATDINPFLPGNFSIGVDVGFRF